jgi:hypothetical protein
LEQLHGKNPETFVAQTKKRVKKLESFADDIADRIISKT